MLTTLYEKVVWPITIYVEVFFFSNKKFWDYEATLEGSHAPFMVFNFYREVVYPLYDF